MYLGNFFGLQQIFTGDPIPSGTEFFCKKIDMFYV